MINTSMRELVELLKGWATASPEISRVLVAGSQANSIESDIPPSKDSDVDIIVYLNPGCIGYTAMKILSQLSINTGILIHPLMIRFEDADIKNNIPEYKKMITMARLIYQYP